MTIKECIDIVDNIKPNQYTVSDKVRWLSFHDMGIINDVLKTHEGYDKRYDLFDGYTEDKLSVALIVPSPYDRLYPEYLKMKIDGENGETAKYNNSAALYNSYLMDYRKYYNKTHMPLDATRRGYRYEAPKKHTVGLTAAEYENLKRDLYYALSADVNEVVSPDKLYDIVTSYAYNNIEMLKGKDGKTPQKGIDYWTQEDVEEITDKASDIVKENVYTKTETDKFLGNKADISHTKNKDNPHEVTAEQVGAYPKFEGNELKQKVYDIEATAKKHHSNRDNPHGVTAQSVGAYTTSETDNAIKKALEGMNKPIKVIVGSEIDNAENISDGNICFFRNNSGETYEKAPFNTAVIFTQKPVETNEGGYYTQIAITDTGLTYGRVGFLNGIPDDMPIEMREILEWSLSYDKRIFEFDTFQLTDFEFECNEIGAVYVDDTMLRIAGTAEPVKMKCAGKNIGFACRVSGYSDAQITVNGKVYTVGQYGDSDGEKEIGTFVLPPTFMESDIVFQGGMNEWYFVTDAGTNAGTMYKMRGNTEDIEKALDGIIAIQNQLIGGDA